MNDPIPLDDLIADDLLLDRLAGRQPAGDEPVAALLCAVATHADRPLTGRTRRRRPHGRRLFAAFAIITVGASGAGVAAAVTLPNYLPGAAERARVERAMDANAASDRPSALLARLGIPAAADAALGAGQGLVLVRRSDGQIVLLPAAAVARPGEITGALAGLALRGGLTGTPQVPGALGNGELTDGADGNAYAYGHDKTAAPGSGGPTVDTPTSSSGSSSAAGGQPGTDDDGDGDKPVASGKKPATGNNGKTGKGQDKVKTTAVTPPATAIVPTPAPTPTTSPTESQALVAPGSSQAGTTSRRSARSTQTQPQTQGQTQGQAQGQTQGQTGSPAPPDSSRGDRRPVPSAQHSQPARTAQPGHAVLPAAAAAGAKTAAKTTQAAESEETAESNGSSESVGPVRPNESNETNGPADSPAAQEGARSQGAAHAAAPATGRP